ncbi:MAG: capsule assembly Wzi family protein, partial [Gemmatimonadaceae bacterium]
DLLDVFGGVFNKGKRAEPNGPLINDDKDQLASVTARWLLPESGAEFYAEYARNDFAGGFTDLVQEPDHARGFTIGFAKTLPVATGALVLRAENTTLGQTATRELRPGAVFYVHGIVNEGYTNRGQLLGASIGPGSNAQFLGLDRYTSRGRYGIFAERIRYDDDYSFAALQGREDGYLSQQVDLSAGVSVLRFSGPWDFGATLAMTRELNRYFIHQNNVTNWRLTFNLGLHRNDAGSTSQR